jgi:hypothetical protein
VIWPLDNAATPNTRKTPSKRTSSDVAADRAGCPGLVVVVDTPGSEMTVTVPVAEIVLVVLAIDVVVTVIFPPLPSPRKIATATPRAKTASIPRIHLGTISNTS